MDSPETKARWLLRVGGRELLDAPLARLALDEEDEELSAFFVELDASGEGTTLAELCRRGVVDRLLDERFTERESETILRRLRALVGEGHGAEDEPTRLVSLPPLPDDPIGLTAWAKSHRVGAELMRPIGELLLGRSRESMTLLEACFATREAKRGRPLDEANLETEARAYLVAEASRVLAPSARIELWKRKVAPSLLRLVERLRALVGATTVEELATLRFVPTRPVSLDATNGKLVASLRDGDSAPVLASLFLAGYETRGLEGNCSRCSRPRCLHLRILAARAIDACHDPADRLRPALEAFTSAPSWTGFIASLVEEAPAVSRLEFVLRTNASGTLVAPRTKGANTSRAKPKIVPAQKLLSSGPLEDGDRSVLEAIAASTRTFGTAFVPVDAPILRALVGHPSVRDEATDELVRVSEQGLHVDFVEVPGGVSPRVSLGGIAMEPREGERATLAITRDRGNRTLYFGSVAPALRRLLSSLADYRAILPEESYAALAPFVAKLREVARVSAPSAFDGLERPPPSKLTLRLERRHDDGIDVSLVVRAFPLAVPYPPGTGPALVHGLEHGVRVVTRRDLVKERELADEVLELLGANELPELSAFSYRVDAGTAVLELVARASRASALVDLEWAEGTRRGAVVGTISSSDVALTVTRKGRYLALEGHARIGESELPLVRLFEAARRGERFVRIDGDDHAEIERALLDKLEASSLALQEQSGELMLALAAAPSVMRTLNGLEIGTDAETDALLSSVLGTPGEELQVPTLNATLRDYQIEGVRFLLGLSRWAPGACLADEMGLGKTVQSIALLEARRELGPQLVIGPTSMVSSWVASIERFAPGLRPLAYRGAGRETMLGTLGPNAVLVTTHDIALRDEEALAPLEFATLVIDEAQLLKNPRTARSTAIAGLRASFRVALTGTPIENRLGDLYGIFRLVAPELLGSAARFRARFAVPIERYDDLDRAAVLRSLVRPFLLRRTKDDVELELPSRTETVLLVELSPAERELYAAAERHATAMLDRHHREKVGRSLELLAELTRLRRLACHPRLAIDDSRIESSKLRAFLELVEDLRRRGHRALVFSQFTSHLALVREALDSRAVRYLELDGSTPGAARGEHVSRFQAGEGELFLISLKAGGTGLDLTAADYVIHLDPWWNPAAEDQASDRAHRIGQTKPVTIVRLVSRGTIEEKVLELHEQKRELARAVLEGTAGTIEPSLSELRSLFGSGAFD